MPAVSIWQIPRSLDLSVRRLQEVCAIGENEALRYSSASEIVQPQSSPVPLLCRFVVPLDVTCSTGLQIMSEIWKTMSGDEREAYRSRARDDQKRYKAEQADKVCGEQGREGSTMSLCRAWLLRAALG